ncbi:MAG: hypothetical protein HUJ70_11490 [Pseudobutyrivibrio sp.]|nr:hypothetical protein [Pseudobutyrivibrio sp.]
MFEKIPKEYKYRIKEFDEQADFLTVLLYRFLVVIIAFILISIGLIDDLKLSLTLMLIFFGFTPLFMNRFFSTKDRKTKAGANVYTITKYAPIPKKAYVIVRMEYMVKLFSKILIAALIIKTLICYLDKTPFVPEFYALTILTVFVLPVFALYLGFKSALRE